MAIVRLGVEGDGAPDEGSQQELRNVRRGPRVALSCEAPSTTAVGMRDDPVVHGRACIEVGGIPRPHSRSSPPETTCWQPDRPSCRALTRYGRAGTGRCG